MVTTDRDGFDYQYAPESGVELWFRPYYDGYSVKAEPYGSVKYIGNRSVLDMVLDGSLPWEAIA